MKSSSIKCFCRSVLRAVCLALLLIAVQPVSTAYAETLREAAERVARQHDAKVVSAREITDRNGRKIYVIRILTRDGVVRTIRVPVGGAQQEWYLSISEDEEAYLQFSGFSLGVRKDGSHDQPQYLTEGARV